MANRHHKSSSGRFATPKKRGRDIVRQIFHGAFVHAVRKSRFSQARISRALDLSPRTLSGWLAGKHRIDFERVATDPRIWAHFLRCLVVLERKARVHLMTVRSVPDLAPSRAIDPDLREACREFRQLRHELFRSQLEASIELGIGRADGGADRGRQERPAAFVDLQDEADGGGAGGKEGRVSTFKVGDRVRVIDGPRAGEVATVTSPLMRVRLHLIDGSFQRYSWEHLLDLQPLLQRYPVCAPPEWLRKLDDSRDKSEWTDELRRLCGLVDA